MFWIDRRHRKQELGALNPGARSVLDYVVDAAHGGAASTIADIARDLVRANSTVVSQCELLETRELVTVARFSHGRERVVSLTLKGKIVCGVGVPEWGVTPGGDLVYEQAFDDGSGGPRWLETLRDVVDYQPGDYCLRVTGNSMAGDGIFDGARVWFHPVEPWQRLSVGTIVHAEVVCDERHKITLKHFWPDEERGIIRLLPSAPGFSTIEKPAEDVVIRGYAYHVQSSLPCGLEMAAPATKQAAQRKAA